MAVPYAAKVQSRNYQSDSLIGGMLTSPLPSVSVDQPASPVARGAAPGMAAAENRYGRKLGFSPTLSRGASLRLSPQSNAMVSSFGAQAVEGEVLPGEYWRGAYATEEARIDDELRQEESAARERAIARGEEGSSTYSQGLRNLRAAANRRKAETRRTLLQSRGEAIRQDRQFAEQMRAQKAIARMGMFRPSAMGVAGGGKKDAGDGLVKGKVAVPGVGAAAKVPWAGPQPGDDPDRAPNYGATTEDWITEQGRRGMLVAPSHSKLLGI